jgi:hypothetical protein
MSDASPRRGEGSEKHRKNPPKIFFPQPIDTVWTIWEHTGRGVNDVTNDVAVCAALPDCSIVFFSQ